MMKSFLNAKALVISVSFFHLFAFSPLHAQVYNQIDEEGNVTQRDEREGNRNFNPHNNDTTSKAVEIPRGIHVWTVDRKFGDVMPAVIDTMPHLFMKSIFNSGVYGEYNTTGNNYTARLNRIFADRPISEQFIFTEPYSYVYKAPDQLHFTNTLSPLTNMTYNSCGDKQNGEDYLNARFAVNVDKRLGFGFDLNYAYARGYFNNQSTAHFGATFFLSYLGDQYNLHTMFSTYHQKAAENGGITDDVYIVRPESVVESFQESEVPTVLYRNWNRNDNLHFFLTHRYNLGFYRKEKLTDDELKARQFAAASKKEKDKKDKERKGKKNDKKHDGADSADDAVPAGRPDDAKIAGDEPLQALSDSALVAADSTRIKVGPEETEPVSSAASTSPADSTLKDVFVPVTSFIHTLEANKYTRTYLAYESPDGYYLDDYFPLSVGDSIHDETRYLQLKNTLALALVEGFNKYAKAGLKAFVSHELRQFHMDDLLDERPYRRKYTEHNVSIGGKLSKTEGKTLHYNLQAETWLVGEDAGQLKVDFTTDLNFPMPLLGDTVQLAARAWFYRLNPTFYQRRYHSRHFWWDWNDDDYSMETRTRVEGTLSYQKTDTRLRVAVEEIQNYTYLGMQYDVEGESAVATRKAFTASPHQYGKNLNVMTAQLLQNFHVGVLHWDNIITYQNSSSKDVLPLPAFNFYSNLYLHFMIAKVLTVDLGGDVTYFTKYDAPDFCPQLNQYAVQQNESSRVELGGYPFVNIYANMHLKRARFYVMMSNVATGMANRCEFLTPHYPVNSSVLRMGVSWNFFN